MALEVLGLRAQLLSRDRRRLLASGNLLQVRVIRLLRRADGGARLGVLLPPERLTHGVALVFATHFHLGTILRDDPFELGVSHTVEVGVLEALQRRKPLVRLHGKHAVHERECLRTHFANILALERFWLAELWELEADEAGVRVKLLLQAVR